MINNKPRGENWSNQPLSQSGRPFCTTFFNYDYILTSKANNKRYLYLHELYQSWHLDEFMSIIVNAWTFLFWVPLLLLKLPIFFFSDCHVKAGGEGFNVNDFCEVAFNYFIRCLGRLNCFVCTPVLVLTWEGLPFDAICDYHNVTVVSCSERIKFQSF